MEQLIIWYSAAFCYLFPLGPNNPLRPCSQTTSVCVLPSNWRTKFAHIRYISKTQVLGGIRNKLKASSYARGTPHIVHVKITTATGPVSISNIMLTLALSCMNITATLESENRNSLNTYWLIVLQRYIARRVRAGSWDVFRSETVRWRNAIIIHCA
jgi:hypothetical protein